MHIGMLGPCSPNLVLDLIDVDPSQLSGITPDAGIPVAELSRELIRRGHQVTIAALDSAISTSRTLVGPGFSLTIIPQRPAPRSRVRDFFRAERRHLSEVQQDATPDLVHAHWTYEYELAAQALPVPHVTTIHDVPLAVLRQLPDAYRLARTTMAWRARPGIRRASAVSHYAARRWRREMLYRKSIKVIPNVISQFRHTERRYPCAEPTLLDVASGSRHKNIPRLLEAFAELRRDIPNAQLRLIGPSLGPTSAMAQLMRRMGLEGVTFLGPRPRSEIGKEMQRAWLLTHLSLEESFSLVALEAHFSGLPVMAGLDSGGITEVLDYGRAGLLVDARDPRAISTAIRSAITDGPPIQSPEVRDWVKETYAPDVVGSAYLTWYRESLR